jgi:hypothetical protein
MKNPCSWHWRNGAVDDFPEKAGLFYDSLKQQILDFHGQPSDTHSGGMINRGRNRSGNPCQADLSYATRPIFIQNKIRIIQKRYIDLRSIGIYRSPASARGARARSPWCDREAHLLKACNASKDERNILVSHLQRCRNTDRQLSLSAHVF